MDQAPPKGEVTGPPTRLPAELVVEEGSNRGHSVPIVESVTIGRDEDCEMQVFDTLVSRRHCRIVREANGFRIEDLQSANGTFVNLKRVETAPIFHRDLISCGAVRLRILCPDSTRSRHTRVGFLPGLHPNTTARVPIPVLDEAIEFDAREGLPPPTGVGYPLADLIATLNHCHAISRQSDTPAATDALLNAVRELTHCKTIVVFRSMSGNRQFLPMTHWRAEGNPTGGTIAVDRARLDQCGLSGRGYAQRDPSGGLRIIVPMEGRESMYGALYIETGPGDDLRPRLPLLAMVCRQAGLVLDQWALLSTVRQQKLSLEEARNLAAQATQAMMREQNKVIAMDGQVRHLQKIDALGRLSGGIAHDFNNLLTVILGFTDNLLRNLAGDAKSTRLLGEIRKAGERAAGLTQQLLAFGRRQILQTREVDLEALVNDLRAMLERVLGEAMRLEVHAAPGLAHIQADPGQLQQVLVNLVVNARDASPPHGIVRIEMANADIDPATIRAVNVPLAGASEPPAPRRVGAYVSLAVIDHGSGMDAETQERIFEPFFTTKPVGKGTGLGLSTVFGIVTQSGGLIRVDSAPGRGTTMTVYLPAVRPGATQPGAAVARA